jgi:FKBP-type peptidyl-prolyl cis-trans isomerase
MKKIIAFLAVVLVVAACGEKERDFDEFGNPYPDLVLNSFEDRISYGMGADMGANFQNMPEELFEQLNKRELEVGFLSGLQGEKGERPECEEMLRSAFGAGNGIDTTHNSIGQISECYGYIFGEMTLRSLQSKDAVELIDPIIAAKGFAHSLFDIDTLIPLDERAKMIADFNNDMNRKKGEKLMVEVKNLPNVLVDDAGFVLQKVKGGQGVSIDPSKEYLMVYTMMNANRDTLFTTISNPFGDEASENALEIIGQDIVEGWRMATKHMEVGGEYIVYLPQELAYGENGLRNPYGPGFYIHPYSAIIIGSKVLEQAEKHAFIKARGEKIIADAKAKPNTKTGASGWVLETLSAGSGVKVPAGSDVKAHYILSDSRGEVVENSYMAAMQGRPAPSFSLNGVIKGWQDAVPEMQKGGRYKLYLPYDIAYGESGSQSIAPYETLTFEMEILDFGVPGSLTGQGR